MGKVAKLLVHKTGAFGYKFSEQTEMPLAYVDIHGSTPYPPKVKKPNDEDKDPNEWSSLTEESDQSSISTYSGPEVEPTEISTE